MIGILRRQVFQFRAIEVDAIEMQIIGIARLATAGGEVDFAGVFVDMTYLLHGPVTAGDLVY